MWKRWFLYLTAVLGCLVFYLAYQQWLSWILLMGVLFVPALSLAVSLPAMVLSKVRRATPAAVPMRKAVPLQVQIQSKLITPPWRVSVQVYHTLTGDNQILRGNDVYPTQHCGALNCKVRSSRVYDLLAMFFLPLKKPENYRIYIHPAPLAPSREPDLSQVLVNAWRPKPGGGFAENHELRLYRPGDNLRQIHWKLTAKTGKLILREPMVPEQSRLVLWLTLQGTPEELDRKLGRLVWMSQYLLRQQLTHDIVAFTGLGEQTWHVAGNRSLRCAVENLLCHPKRKEADIPLLTQQAHWQYYIGGEADEDEA